MKKKKPPVLLITALLVLLAGGAFVNQIIGKPPTPDTPQDPGPVAQGDKKTTLGTSDIKNIVKNQLGNSTAKQLAKKADGAPDSKEVTSPMILTDEPLQARAVEHPVKGLPSDTRTSTQWYRSKAYSGRHSED